MSIQGGAQTGLLASSLQDVPQSEPQDGWGPVLPATTVTVYLRVFALKLNPSCKLTDASQLFPRASIS